MPLSSPDLGKQISGPQETVRVRTTDAYRTLIFLGGLNPDLGGQVL